MLENLNTTLFLWVNAPATPNPTILFIARIAADWAIYAVALALIFGWIRGGLLWRKILFVAAISGAVALMINLTIASIYYHPRPFEIGLGHQFLAHAVETSFPSDHATVLFAIAFAILLNGGLTVWGGGSHAIAAKKLRRTA